MAIITHALLAALTQGFKASFQKKFGETPSDYASIATTVPSVTASNIYGWLGEFPDLEEWIGSRVLKDMKEHGYTIVNKLFESTVSVKRTQIEDDQAGLYKPMVEEMGRAAKIHPDKLCFGLLKEGATTACYDGQNFFDAEHPVYPAMDGTGAAALVSNYSEGTGPAWYLMDTSRALKPILFQERSKPEFETITDTKNDTVFLRDLYLYGVRSRCNVGFGFWQLAYCSKKPLNEENFNAAYDAMAAFKGDGGRPLGIKADTLLVPTNLRTAADEICKAARKENGATNTNANLVKSIVTPWLN